MEGLSALYAGKEMAVLFQHEYSSAQVSALDGLVPLFGGTSGLGGMFLPGSQL